MGTYIINGATGWLGRTAVNFLLNSLGCEKEEIIAIGSTRRVVKFRSTSLEILTFRDLPNVDEVELYFDLAFLTREYESKVGMIEYEKINRNLIDNSRKIIERYKPTSVFLASSGAVYDAMSTSQNSTLYGKLKLEQEKELTDVTKLTGSFLTICRIFNLSGEFINKTKTFALANFIHDAMTRKEITIRSKELVLRRYCDAEELIELAIALKGISGSRIFDSGGFRIELKELANLIGTVLDSRVQVYSNSGLDQPNPDVYLSESENYEELLMSSLGKAPLSLERQIQKSYLGMFPGGRHSE